MKHPAFDELMAIVRAAFPNNSPRGQELFRELEEWKTNWFEMYGYENTETAMHMQYTKDDPKYADHITQKLHREVGAFAAKQEAIMTEKWDASKAYRKRTAELFVIRKESLRPMTAKRNQMIQASNAMEAAIRAVTMHQAGYGLSMNVHDQDPYAHVAKGFPSAHKKPSFDVVGEYDKATGGTKPNFEQMAKVPVCECGKEKHGFASHAQWCDIK